VQDASYRKKIFFKVFDEAFDYGITIENCQGGFRGSGLIPFNPEAIPDSAYDPSSTTERELVVDTPSVHKVPSQSSIETATTSDRGHRSSEDLDITMTSKCNAEVSSRIENSFDIPVNPETTNNKSDAEPDGPSDTGNVTVIRSNEQIGLPPCTNPKSCGDAVTFENLLPVPKRDRAQSNRRRQKSPSYELTSDKCIQFVNDAANRKKNRPKEKKTNTVTCEKTKNTKSKKR
jgi:hypothetical protein